MTHLLVGPSKTTVLVVQGSIVTFPHSAQPHCLLSSQTHPTCPLSTVKQPSLLGMGEDSNQTMSSCLSIINIKSLHPTFFVSMMITVKQLSLLGMGGDSNQTMSSHPSIINIESLHLTFFTLMVIMMMMTTTTAGEITGITMALMLTHGA